MVLIYTGWVIFLMHPHMTTEEGKGRALFFLEGLHPHKLIAPQRPQLPVPSLWRLVFQYRIQYGGITKMQSTSIVDYAIYSQWDLVRLFMILCM